MFVRIVPAVLATAATSLSFAGAECVTRFDLFATRGDAMSFALAMPLAGTFIGDYDATTNPGGTRTIPGLFGGSGNHAIPFTSVIKPAANIAFPLKTPVFSFCMVDEGGGNATVTCVELDMIRGTPAPITINLTITYPNFHTVAPTAIFPGVSNLTLPLPAGSITQASAVQTAPASGTLLPGKGGTLILTALVPMELTFEATVLDQPIVLPPTALDLPLIAELQPSLTGDYFAVVALEIPTTEVVLPLAGQLIENQPFDLPTLLPPGNTAHLLVSGAFADGTASFGLSADLSGDGEKIGPIGDLTGDCLVNGADLAVVLGSWGEPGGPADLNEDGIVNSGDIAIVLGNWS